VKEKRTMDHGRWTIYYKLLTLVFMEFPLFFLANISDRYIYKYLRIDSKPL